MPLLSMFFRQLGFRNRVGLLRLDATLQEVHERTSRVTDHPIEGGSTIQDHIVRNPRRLTMEGYITDTPLSGGSVGVTTAYDILDLTWTLGIPFTVISGFRVYPLMAFEQLTMPNVRASEMRFTAQMKELTVTFGRTVGVSSTSLSEDSVSDAPAQAVGSEAGRQPTSDAGPLPNSASSDTGPTGGSDSLLSQLF